MSEERRYYLKSEAAPWVIILVIAVVAFLIYKIAKDGFDLWLALLALAFTAVFASIHEWAFRRNYYIVFHEDHLEISTLLKG